MPRGLRRVSSLLELEFRRCERARVFLVRECVEADRLFSRRWIDWKLGAGSGLRKLVLRTWAFEFPSRREPPRSLPGKVPGMIGLARQC